VQICRDLLFVSRGRTRKVGVSARALILARFNRADMHVRGRSRHRIPHRAQEPSGVVSPISGR